MKKLSEHFTYDEMTTSQTAVRFGLKNEPGKKELKNLKVLCKTVLESFRSKVGPLMVMSGYRSPEVNRRTGGALKSQHCLGQAADIIPMKYDLKKAYLCLVDSNIPYDQAIFEFGRWIHVSWALKPRRQCLVASKRGAKTVYALLDIYGRNNL